MSDATPTLSSLVSLHAKSGHDDKVHSRDASGTGKTSSSGAAPTLLDLIKCQKSSSSLIARGLPTSTGLQQKQPTDVRRNITTATTTSPAINTGLSLQDLVRSHHSKSDDSVAIPTGGVDPNNKFALQQTTSSVCTLNDLLKSQQRSSFSAKKNSSNVLNPFSTNVTPPPPTGLSVKVPPPPGFSPIISAGNVTDTKVSSSGEDSPVSLLGSGSTLKGLQPSGFSPLSPCEFSTSGVVASSLTLSELVHGHSQQNKSLSLSSLSKPHATLSQFLQSKSDSHATQSGFESLSSASKRDHDEIRVRDVKGSISMMGVVLCRNNKFSDFKYSNFSQKRSERICKKLSETYFSKPRFNFSTPSPDDHVTMNQNKVFKDKR